MVDSQHVVQRFILTILSHLISTNSVLSQPTVAFRYDGAPDALVYEVCGVFSLKEMMAGDKDGWGIGMRCCLRANKTLIEGVSFIWSSLSNNENCFDRILVAGYFKVRAVICDWKWECEFGIESEEVNIHIRKNPFHVSFLAQRSNVEGDNVSLKTSGGDAQARDNRSCPAVSKRTFNDTQK